MKEDQMNKNNNHNNERQKTFHQAPKVLPETLLLRQRPQQRRLLRQKTSQSPLTAILLTVPRMRKQMNRIIGRQQLMNLRKII